MKYIIMPNTCWMYPDVSDYPEQSDKIELETGRYFTAACQIMLIGAGGAAVDWSCERKGVSLRPLIPVFVSDNPGLDCERDHFPERKAPYYVYDCIGDFDDERYRGENTGLYFTFDPSGCDAGEIRFTLCVSGLNIPVRIVVRDVGRLDEELLLFNNYLPQKAAERHNIPIGSPEFAELNEKYLTELRKMHQTALYVPDFFEKKDVGGKTCFDFTKLIDFCRSSMKLGFRYFYLPAIANRKKWNLPTILIDGKDAMSIDAYDFAKRYLTELRTALLLSGISPECFYMSVADEPNSVNATEYCAVCGLIKKFLPEVKLLDAIMIDSIHFGPDAVAITPTTYLQRKNLFDYLNGDMEIFYYVALSPRKEGIINRFIDFPLLTTRYLHWANYLYRFKGYLHWAVNFYQENQDPFRDTCCLHYTFEDVWKLPPGDTHIFYPGKHGPYISLRSENERMSAEEYAMFSALSKTDKNLADELCRSAFRAFDDYEFDARKFEETRKRLLTALEKIGRTEEC